MAVRFRRWTTWSLVAFPAALVLVYLLQLPFRSAAPVVEFEWIAHRGVHQTFSDRDLDNFTCTATRIFAPTHNLLENTFPAMAAAFDRGAQTIELDVHRTADGELAVFHDWTVDCRTEGSGETRSLTLSQLKSLDVGYGYSADGGISFPFRGQGVGLLPSLREVLRQFPQGRFMVDQKDRSPDTTALIARLVKEEAASDRVCLNALPELNADYLAQVTGGCAMSDRRGIKRCLVDYLSTGWTSRLPPSCIGQRLTLPDWPAMRLLWGWPGTFIERMHAHGGKVYVWSNDPERVEYLRALGIDGILTDYIERMPIKVE